MNGSVGGDDGRARGSTVAAGHYPVPAHAHGHEVVERRWDGDVWLDEVREAPADIELAG